MDASDLVEKYKRDGHFDSVRKELLNSFRNDPSGTGNRLEELLSQLIDIKMKDDPASVAENPAKFVALTQASLAKHQLGEKISGYNKYSTSGNNQSATKSPGEDNVISQIDDILNGYVSKAVTNSEDLRRDLEKSLSGIEKNH